MTYIVLILVSMFDAFAAADAEKFIQRSSFEMYLKDYFTDPACQVSVFLEDLEALPSGVMPRECGVRSCVPHRKFVAFLKGGKEGYSVCDNILVVDVSKAISYMWDDCKYFIERYEKNLEHTEEKLKKTTNTHIMGCRGTLQIITKLMSFFKKHHLFLSSLYSLTEPNKGVFLDFMDAVTLLTKLRAKWEEEYTFWLAKNLEGNLPPGLAKVPVIQGDGLADLRVRLLMDAAGAALDPFERLQCYLDAVNFVAQDGDLVFVLKVNKVLSDIFDN